MYGWNISKRRYNGSGGDFAGGNRVKHEQNNELGVESLIVSAYNNYSNDRLLILILAFFVTALAGYLIGSQNYAVAGIIVCVILPVVTINKKVEILVIYLWSSRV